MNTSAAAGGVKAHSVVGSGVLLMVAMAAVSAGNYGLNIGLGRWLAPAEFGDVALMVTIMLMTTVFTSSLQVATATIVARGGVAGITLAAVDRLRTQATRWGAAMGAVGVIAAVPTASFLRVENPVTLAVMAVGLPLHLRLGVDRGHLQGELDLRRLAGSFGAEMIGRTVVTVALVIAGFGAVGATIGLNVGFVVALGAASRPRSSSGRTVSVDQRRELQAACRQIGVLMIATTIINNGDVLLSKVMLDPDDAGRYAAIALVGRAIFFASWSVQQAAVPLVAQASARSSSENRVAITTIGVTAALVGGMAMIAWRFDDLIVASVFGEDYVSLAPLLGPYALATACFAVAHTIATVDVAAGRTSTSLVLLIGAVVQTVAIAAATTPGAIVAAQVWSMVLLLGAVGVARRSRPNLNRTGIAVDLRREGAPA